MIEQVLLTLAKTHPEYAMIPNDMIRSTHPQIKPINDMMNTALGPRGNISKKLDEVRKLRTADD